MTVAVIVAGLLPITAPLLSMLLLLRAAYLLLHRRALRRVSKETRS
jgi:hypothetical protein